MTCHRGSFILEPALVAGSAVHMSASGGFAAAAASVESDACLLCASRSPALTCINVEYDGTEAEVRHLVSTTAGDRIPMEQHEGNNRGNANLAV